MSITLDRNASKVRNINVYRLIAPRDDRDAALAWCKREGRIALGWGEIGDINALNPTSSAEIGEAIRAAYPKLRNSADAESSLWKMFSELIAGDYVVVKSNGESAVFEVDGPYEYCPEKPGVTADYHHQLPAQLTELDPEKTLARAVLMPANSQSTRFALINVGELITADGLSR